DHSRTRPRGAHRPGRRDHRAGLGLGVRGHPRSGGGPLSRRPGARAAAHRRHGARCAPRGARLGGPRPSGVDAPRCLRRRLVRHLQRRPQRRRAAPRRRHHRHAGQHRPDPHRGAGRAAPGRGLPPVAGRGRRRRLPGRAADRRRHPGCGRRPGGGAAVRRRRGHLCHRGGRAEAAAAPAPRPPGHLPRLCHRRGLL
ncbi:MAG: Permease of the drug/metabolite transporter (DMT) superfamily, partial [uncultured Quadrisphaera sp.]